MMILMVVVKGDVVVRVNVVMSVFSVFIWGFFFSSCCWFVGFLGISVWSWKVFCCFSRLVCSFRLGCFRVGWGCRLCWL